MVARPTYDLAVVGLGPAGRALAHRAAAAGLRVLALDPHPGRRWPQTLAGWRRQLPAWVSEDAVGTVSRPVLRTWTERAAGDDYVVLSNDRLRDALDLSGVDIEARVVPDDELGLDGRARVVVDARGVRPAGAVARTTRTPRVPAQTAHGVLVSASDAGAARQGAEAVLMDWRPYHGRPRWGTEPPTFLYVMPLPTGEVLVEETCLAGAQAMPDAELRRRLLLRCRWLGIPPRAVSTAAVERVMIPLERTGPRAAPRFGSAGAQLNPISGYSVFASLMAADLWVDRLKRGRAMPPDRPGLVRRIALDALVRLAPDATVSLFDAFSRLDARHQAAVLDADATTPSQLLAMGAQWWRMPTPDAARLVTATLAGVVFRR